MDRQTRTLSLQNKTRYILAMKLQLVLLAIGLITACLPSGKMEGGDLGLEGKRKSVKSWNKK